MLEKLLSHLPYNPSLVYQLAFYSKRLRQEARLRRMGVVFLVLAFVIQFVAVVSPPQPSVADSINDLVNGGFSTPAQAASYCNNNTRSYQQVLTYYGIGCSELANATTVSIRSTDYNGQLFSSGWKPLGPTHNGRPTDETAAAIPGAGTLYWRLLHSWDTGAYSTYKALKINATSKHGVFFVLYTCGNLVHVGLPSPYVPPAPPPPPPPAPPQVLSCSNLVMNYADNQTVQFDSSIIVRGQAAGSNIKAGQTVDMYYDYVNSANKVVASAKSLGIPFSGTTANDSLSHTFTANSAGAFRVRLTVKYNSTQVATGSATGNCLQHINVAQPCAYDSSLPADSPQCKPCPQAISNDSAKNCLVFSKSATDTNQGWTVNNDQVNTAQPGDNITYSLITQNTGKADVKGFQVQEDMADVLDYVAKDASGQPVMDLHGGSMDGNGLVSWPAETVAANATVTHQITITVANPIPSTPASTSDSSHFDLTMTNTYGNTINIKVPSPPLKTIATTSTALPNTGPGSSLWIAGALVIIAGYFMARSRLLATEANLAAHNSTSGGV